MKDIDTTYRGWRVEVEFDDNDYAEVTCVTSDCGDYTASLWAALDTGCVTDSNFECERVIPISVYNFLETIADKV